jgi:hypothetical protein
MLRHKKVGKYIRVLDPDSNQSAVRIQTQREAKLSQKKGKNGDFMNEELFVGLEASPLEAVKNICDGSRQCCGSFFLEPPGSRSISMRCGSGSFYHQNENN